MDHTIAAISTGVVKSGIGIVRMSGENSIEIGKRIFKSVSGKAINEEVNKKLLLGHIYDKENLIDEVLISFMYGPNTYTTEDMVEIYCHGSVISLKKIFELLLREGASHAEKGEFTKRAFLNGRLDLSQAEAVQELIDANTEKAYEASLNQLRGGLSEEIRKLRDMTQHLLANAEVIINFSEDEEYLDDTEIRRELGEVREEIEKLIDSSKKGRLIKDGIKTIILGKPNVGKSSLLNALLRENRAIVTDVPGTTRDVIEEQIIINSIPINIIDTAGIRETDDKVEKIGVEKSIELVNQADLIIGVFDFSKELNEEDKKIIELMEGKTSIGLLNKVDLNSKLNKEELKELLKDTIIIETSMQTSKGVDELEEAISDKFFLGEIDPKENLLVTNSRHIDLLKKARQSIDDATDALNAGLPLELIEVDIRGAWLYHRKITGENMDTDELLNQIFDEFCIGK